MGGLWLGRPRTEHDSIATAGAQRQTLTLADGTRAELNAQTSLQVEIGAAERRVRLASGEAFFTVSKDKNRPFFVETPAGSVRVTGTVFNVRSETTTALEVVVVEGSVQVRPGESATGRPVEPVALVAGDQLSAGTDGVSVQKLSAGAVDDELAWRHGQVVFKGVPLSAVLARFAHYHGRGITAAPEVAQLRVGGRYSLDDLDTFLAAIEPVLHVRVTRGLSGTIQVGPADKSRWPPRRLPAITEPVRGRPSFPTQLRFLSFLAGCCWPWAGAPVLALAAPVDFNLPAQPTSDALLAFSQQAKIEVLFSFDDLHQVGSTAVVGRYEPTEAIVRLLGGSGFAAQLNGGGKFVVTPSAPLAGTIKGRLLAPDGTAAAGVRVTLRSARRFVRTDVAGEYVFDSVRPGTYELVVDGTGYQSVQLSGVQVASNRLLTLETQTLKIATDPTQLEPYIVEAKAAKQGAFDLSRTPFMPPSATGNLDLPRTVNDALPFSIYDRDQITRSGVVDLNEFLRRNVLESDAATQPPEQNGAQDSFVVGSNNLNLRGYGADETVILVNGRRMPEVLTNVGGTLPPDVNFIPLSLVQQVEVLPVSASALYNGNAVGGVINIVLRSSADINATEVTGTYTNALGRFDAPQSTVSLVNGQTLLDGKLHLRFNASFTWATPPTEAELGYHQARVLPPPGLEEPVYRATPNIRSADGTPLFGPGSSPVTSVAPGADGTGGLAAFAGRQGVRNFGFFDAPADFAASPNSLQYPYGRRQKRATYFLSVAYDAFPWLQIGVDGTYVHTVVNRGFDVLTGDLTLAAANPLNPFHQDVNVSLNEVASKLGEDYSEARLDFASAVVGLLVRLPSDWRVTLDTQYAHNLVKYRGIAGADTTRWQELVDDGVYNPLRDTQLHGPPQAFYDRVLVYYGGPGRFVTLGDYDTNDAAARVTNESLSQPTGLGKINFGGDYRSNHLGSYTEQPYFADGTLAHLPAEFTGRTLQRYSVFGEFQAPLLPESWLPRWLHRVETDLAVRYVAADSSRETNVAPTVAL